MECFECGAEAEYDHHVVPRIRGGTKTVPLCGVCHALVHERDKPMSTSQLTKEGQAKAKARGVKLGSARPGHWDGREHLRQAGIRKGGKIASERRRKRTAEFDEKLAPLLRELRLYFTLQDVADVLNSLGSRTQASGRWTPPSVYRALHRLGIDS